MADIILIVRGPFYVEVPGNVQVISNPPTDFIPDLPLSKPLDLDVHDAFTNEKTKMSAIKEKYLSPSGEMEIIDLVTGVRKKLKSFPVFEAKPIEEPIGEKPLKEKP